MEKKLTHWKKAFDSDYLSTADINGDDIKAIIGYVKLEEVNSGARGKHLCNVAHFTDKALKPMILNVTNSKVVKKFAGSKFIEEWQNIPVQIYAEDNIKAFGEVTEGLRIRSQQPKVGKPELLPDTEQWNKAVKYIKDDGKIENITGKYLLSEKNAKKLEEAADVA